MDKETFGSYRDIAYFYREHGENTAFWAAYARGLNRLYHGDRWETLERHELFMSLDVDADILLTRSRARGYRAGFAGEDPHKFLA